MFYHLIKIKLLKLKLNLRLRGALYIILLITRPLGTKRNLVHHSSSKIKAKLDILKIFSFLVLEYNILQY